MRGLIKASASDQLVTKPLRDPSLSIVLIEHFDFSKMNPAGKQRQSYSQKARAVGVPLTSSNLTYKAETLPKTFVLGPLKPCLVLSRV